MNDATLIQQAARGDRAAQGVLARSSFHRVLAYCQSRVCQLADAEELTQEILIRAVLNLTALSDPEKYDAWLRGIAAHLCADWHRRRNRIPAVSLSESETNSDMDPVEQVSRADEREMLQKQMRELPEDLREVLFLFYYEEKSYEQMAESTLR